MWAFACGKVRGVFLGGLDNRHFANAKRITRNRRILVASRRSSSAYYPSTQKIKDTAKAMSFILVGEGGFEPPKAKPADLQSVPFGHSGTLPNPTIATIPQQNRFVKGNFCFFVTIFANSRLVWDFSLDEWLETCYTWSVQNEHLLLWLSW